MPLSTPVAEESASISASSPRKLDPFRRRDLRRPLMLKCVLLSFAELPGLRGQRGGWDNNWKDGTPQRKFSSLHPALRSWTGPRLCRMLRRPCKFLLVPRFFVCPTHLNATAAEKGKELKLGYCRADSSQRHDATRAHESCLCFQVPPTFVDHQAWRDDALLKLFLVNTWISHFQSIDTASVVLRLRTVRKPSTAADLTATLQLKGLGDKPG